MINELSLEPFNKLNCMGMLNTLLPPMPDNNSRLASPLLTHQTLKQERESFFRYIQQVQNKGPHVLDNLTQGEKTKWDTVHVEVDKYLRVAKNIIDDSMAILGTDDFQCIEEVRKGKKTDSGVSFGSEMRSSSECSIEALRPISPAPSYSTSKSSTTLEKLAREFKRMRVKSRPDVEEMVKMGQHSPMETDQKTKKAKKVRSLVNLKGSNASSTSVAGSRKGSVNAPFDVDEMKRARMNYEASVAK